MFLDDGIDIELVALGVAHVALGVELVALGEELVALGAELVALVVELAALGVELVAGIPRGCDCVVLHVTYPSVVMGAIVPVVQLMMALGLCFLMTALA